MYDYATSQNQRLIYSELQDINSNIQDLSSNIFYSFYVFYVFLSLIILYPFIKSLFGGRK